MPAKNIDQDKPAPVALNLDTLDRPGGNTQPFVFVLSKQRFQLPNPRDMDYRDLIGAMNAAQAQDFETALLLLVAEKDRDAFFKMKIPVWKLEPLFEKYIDYYDLPSAGEADALPG